jgi:Clp amino terminal domain, pathogenicity island component
VVSSKRLPEIDRRESIVRVTQWCFHQARSARHEFLTVEQLLLVILDVPKGRDVLEGCGADLRLHVTSDENPEHHAELAEVRFARRVESLCAL